MLRLFTAIALIILLGYGFIEARPLLAGPELTLLTPASGTTSSDGFFTIAGNAKRSVALTLDGAPLLVDEQGDFSKIIVLPRGGAILTVVATDRFGRTITKQESVYVP